MHAVSKKKKQTRVLCQEIQTQNAFMSFNREYIRKDNEACLTVYNTLRDGCNNISKSGHPYLNLIVIFFHDLIKILTGYILKLREIEEFSNIVDFSSFPDVKSYPYIGYKDVVEQVDCDYKNYKKQTMGSMKSRVKYLASKTVKNLKKNNTLKVGMMQNIPLIENTHCKKFFTAPPISVPDFTQQMHTVFGCIDEIWNKLNIKTDSFSMKKLIEKHIETYIKKQCVSPELNIDVFVTWGLWKVSSRIVAVICRSEEIPIISIVHGEGDGLLDEPVFSYGERELADAVLGFGPFFREKIESYRFLIFSKGTIPHYICSNSSKIKKIYKTPYIIPVNSIEQKRIMYVPTSYSGVKLRYGPFRDMPDMMYLKWQEELLKSFPDLIWKGHPKEKGRRDLLPSNVKHISRKIFEDCFSDADVFFFDYISSAFYIACATDKPIVYFDIGLRNIAEPAWQLIKKRCAVIEVDDIDNPGYLERKVEEVIKGKAFYNEITKQCSLSPGTDENRFRTLAKTIKSKNYFKLL